MNDTDDTDESETICSQCQKLISSHSIPDLMACINAKVQYNEHNKSRVQSEPRKE